MNKDDRSKVGAGYWRMVRWLVTAGLAVILGCGSADGAGGSADNGEGGTAGDGAGGAAGNGTGGMGGVFGTGGMGGTGGVELPPEAEEDNDSTATPAVYAQFRATSPAPISVGEPLFNDVAVDTRGLQYINAVSASGDGLDVVQFRIIPGQRDPTIRVSLECETTDPARLSAEVLDPDGNVIETAQCGDQQINVFLENASSLDDYQVLVRASEGAPVYGDFTLSINGYCFQQCQYVPYEG